MKKRYHAYRITSSNIHKPIPVVAVDSVVRSDKGVVLVKRKYEPFKGYWSLPGGFVNYGERVEDAAMRETLEETGLKVKIEKLIGIRDMLERDPRWHVISISFLTRIVGGRLKAGEEVEEVGFFKKLPRK